MLKKLPLKAMVLVSLLLFLGSLAGLYFIIGNRSPLPDILGRNDSFGVLEYRYPKETSINQPFRMEVVIDTKNRPVNAVGVYLRYDPQSLQLLNMDTKSSFCQFYPEKKFDDNLGTVSLACGSPHPGVAGVDTVLSLEFMPKKLGNTVIRAEKNSQILLSDGKGTNIIHEYPQAEIMIVNTF